MKNWFRKASDKKERESGSSERQERQDNISSLYEIVEDHLKSLDYDQLRSISGDFAERFAAHQEIISEIVKKPLPRRGVNAGRADSEPDDSVVIDTRLHGTAGSAMNPVAGRYSDEMMLSRYDRMIQAQYERMIDLTMDFLKEVTETEIRRLDAETAKLASNVRDLRDVLVEQIQRLAREFDDTRLLHRDLIAALEEETAELNRKAELASARIKILAGAVIGAGLVAGAAMVLALIR
jgi:hypothetical protein